MGVIFVLENNNPAGTIFRNADYENGNSNINISNIQIDGNHAENDNDNAVWLFNFDNVNNLQISNVSCKDHYYSNLQYEGTKYCFQIWNSRNVNFYNNFFEKTSRCIICRNCHEGSISHNISNESYLRFIEVSNDWQIPIGTHSSNFVVTDNISKVAYSGGGENGEPYYFKADNINCNQNIAEDFYRFGIRFVNSDISYHQQNNKCNNNILIAKQDSNYGNDGIIVYRQDNMQVIGNTIINAKQEGINAEFCSNLSIKDNLIENCLSHGINIQNGIFRANISGNNIVNCVGHGIQVTDSFYSNIHHNHISDITNNTITRGIYLYNAEMANINNNLIENTTNYGIFVNHNIFNADISHNQIHNAKEWGILSVSAKRLTLDSNQIINCGKSIEESGGIKIKSNKYVQINNNQIRDNNDIGSKVTFCGIESENSINYSVNNNFIEYMGDAFKNIGENSLSYEHNNSFTNTNDD